jgi:rhamnogalacturonan acetylesterase
MTDAINQFKAKGAAVVIASQTPRNFFRDNSGVPIFVGYAQQVAMATNVSYVAHYNYTVALYNELGASTVNRYYTGDNIHTSAAGADMVAQAFVRGVLCDETNPIFKLVRNTNVRPGQFFYRNPHFLSKLILAEAACLNTTTPA